jgi:catechol 2,3-dioxygenase-like lactoylglutathione lyase family enzyme
MRMSIQPDMVGLVVNDLASSLRFYQLLGLAFPDMPPDAGYVEVITPNGYRISLNTVAIVQGFDPEWRAPTDNNRISLAFKCGSPAEVGATYARVLQAGHASHKAPWDAFWGQRYAVVLDPDGNTADLFAAL